jgi:hypothetical protein
MPQGLKGSSSYCTDQRGFRFTIRVLRRGIEHTDPENQSKVGLLQLFDDFSPILPSAVAGQLPSHIPLE